MRMMKENILDVLLYLFENLMIEDPESDEDRDSLQSSLLEVGFTPQEIRKAFAWLDELAELRPSCEPRTLDAGGPIRVLAPQEREKLEPEAQGFLMFLEQQAVLSPAQRELVLDRVIALDVGEVDVEELKWVILMVLFNQPDQEAAYSWLENLMFDHDESVN
jgi:Smg protein